MGATAKAQRTANDKRAFPRYSAAGDLLLPVTINEHRHLCRILDLSLGGARLMLEPVEKATDPGPKLGTSGEGALITFDQDDDFAAEMCWQSQQEIGVQFDFSMAALDFVSRCLAGMLPGPGLPNAETSAA